MAKKTQKKNTKPELPFRHKLILNQWVLSLLGVNPLQDTKISVIFNNFTKFMKDPGHEGLNEENIHKFYYVLTESELFFESKITKDQILIYEQNISSLTQKINEKRHRPIVWKYFQWMTLLFTEIYLDRYFGNKQQLLDDLNSYIDDFNEFHSDYADMPKYELDDLNKVCYENATGSGKTLIMHINLLQFQYYAEKYGQLKDLSRVILLTPNERLTEQHLNELKESNLYGQRLEAGSSLFSNPQGYKQVDALEITKLSDKDGPNLIATRNLGSENLLLVDEGHRGMSGGGKSSKQEEGAWFRNRNMLCEKGFTYEYSATFEQSVVAAGDIDLINRYAKNVLFDYSYRYFYEDGFGKDYHILNLSKFFDATYYSYLTACLLKFYQQLRIYEERGKQFQPFNIEKPLWVFVGSSVSKIGGTEDEKNVTSDVAKIIQFIADFLHDKESSIRRISNILKGNGQDTGLIDEKGNDIFNESFKYLNLENNDDKNQIYTDILKKLFQNQAGGKLILERIKGDSGEVLLKCGTADEPFGLINVGDALGLCKHCEEVCTNISVDESEFSQAIFSEVKESSSTVNILIGSKKFIEGWDCWRVSTMGLMHVGQSEGSQIIQLFGRGVRLKGSNWSLKRTTAKYGGIPNSPKYIHELETLNVFGIRADFMEKFKQFLKEEGLPGNEKKHIITIPMNVTYDFGKQLKVLRPKKKSSDGIEYNFKKDAPVPYFGEVPKYLQNNKVISDWYPRIQTIQSLKSNKESQKNSGKLSKHHLSMIDLNKLYFEAEQFKKERSWYNLNINPKSIEKLLSDISWYEIVIPNNLLQPNEWQSVSLWQQIAEELIKRYCDKYYNYKKNEFFEPRMELRELSSDDENIPTKDENYHVIIDESDETLKKQIEQIKKEIELNKDSLIPANNMGDFRAINYNKHLFQPLLHVRSGGEIKVMPVSLNESEYRFVTDLKRFTDTNKEKFDTQELEIFLLRNRSRGKGIGFFEAGNFYPDFILWILHGKKQYINFIEPHGLLREGIASSKIQFHTKIKEIEKRLNENNVVLNSFILSWTEFTRLQWGNSQQEFEKNHILFMENEYLKKLFLLIGVTIEI